MEPNIFQDDEGNWWEIDENELDPNGEPLIVPYEVEE